MHREYKIADRLDYPEAYRLIKQTFGKENSAYPEHPTIICVENNKIIGVLSTKDKEPNLEVVSLCINQPVKALIALRLIDKMDNTLRELGCHYYWFVAEKINDKWIRTIIKAGFSPIKEKQGYIFFKRYL